MKRIITILLILSLFVSAKAQIHFGPQISANVANITNMGSELGNNTEPKPKVGLALGGFVELPIFPIFSIQADLMYSRQGVSLGTAVLDPYDPSSVLQETGKVKVKTHYLNLPIKAKFTFKDSFYAFVGPQFGLCLGGIRKKDDAKLNINSELSSFDSGLIIGAGWQFNIGLNLGISYYLGFDNVFRETGKTSKNRVFAITANWRIR